MDQRTTDQTPVTEPVLQTEETPAETTPTDTPTPPPPPPSRKPPQKNGTKASGTVRSTTATKSKNSSSSKGKNQAAKKKDQLQIRSERPAHRVIPYALFVLAAFLFVCLLLNLFCNTNNQLAGNPSAHWMGSIGYGICYGLFGMLGAAAFALPVLLFNLAFYWKKYIDNRITTSKIVAATMFQLLLSAVVHVFCLSVQLPEDRRLSASELLLQGVQMRGGGVLGGGIGFFLTSYLNIIGALIIGILLLAVLLFYFLGMTPHHLWARYRLWRKVKKEQAEEQAPKIDKPEKNSVKEKKEKKEPEEHDPEEDLAPMPTPRINPDDEEHMFLPPHVRSGLKEEQAKQDAERATEEARNTPPTSPTQAASPAPKTVPQSTGVPARTLPQNGISGAPAKAAAPAAATPTARPTASIPPVGADDLLSAKQAQNRDAAVDPIFPRTVEHKPMRRIPREDRNFDLKKVFIDFDDDEPTPPVRKHAPLPPERPMPGTRPQPRPTMPASPSTAQKPTASAAGDRPIAARPTEGATGVRPARMPSPSTAQAAPAAPAKESSAQKPVFRQAAKAADPKEFGLSSEEFEKLEAARRSTDLSGKKPTPKPEGETAKKAAPAPAKKPVPTPAPPKPKRYTFPPISYLHPGEPMTAENKAEIDESMRRLADALESFRVRVQEINYSCGPTVTRYEVILAPGVRVRSVTNLQSDIALALRSSGGVRIEAPIPGTNAVGIEIPNKTRSTIYLRDMIESRAFVESKSRLSACLGADIAGQPIIFDIAKMPHLLVAGTTGSGKSVCINCIIMSILYKARPDEVKLILIDPKKVEFSIYKNIPHLMAPVVTSPKDAAGALQAAVEEMERRFEHFEAVNVRDLKGYNALAEKDPDLPPMPQMVIIIDELADLMMTAKNEVETAICRIAQKARAAGIHLIIGTQRPSVDVVTGLIKANVPSSIAFAVKSQMDSRVILDHGGAEALTGRGDMLFVPIGSMRDTRVQGAFVEDKEVERICEFIRVTNGSAVYDEGFTSKMKEFSAQCNKKSNSSADEFVAEGADGEARDDPKYVDALRVAIEEKRASTSLLQRKLGVGYSRAAKLVDRMEADGYVGKADGSKPREILITPEEFLEKFVDGAASATDDNA